MSCRPNRTSWCRGSGATCITTVPRSYRVNGYRTALEAAPVAWKWRAAAKMRLGARLDDGSFPRHHSFYPRAGWPLEWERRVSRSACLPEAVPIGSARHGYLKAMLAAYPSMAFHDSHRS